MYLLNSQSEIRWVLGKTSNVITANDLSIQIVQPDGSTSFVDVEQGFVAPTETTEGSVTYYTIPSVEGLWEFTLVKGIIGAHTELSKAVLYVFDKKTEVKPLTYSDGILTLNPEFTGAAPTMTDTMLLLADGAITGYSPPVNKFGRNGNIAANTTETIWDGSSIYSFPATADITHIVQSADTEGGTTIEVQGLDANWDLVLQTKNLDAVATTPVALDTPLRRVFRMKVLGPTTLTSDVKAQNVGGTTDYAIIVAGNNQTLMAVYTVPAGKTAFMTNYYATLNPVLNQDPTTMQMTLWTKDNVNGYAPQIKHSKGLDATGTSGFVHDFKPYFKIGEKHDIYLNGRTVGKAADISAGFDLILKDN